MVSDHYSVFAIRKKCREDRRVIVEIVRVYKNYNEPLFCQLLVSIDWEIVQSDPNPESQWKFYIKMY